MPVVAGVKEEEIVGAKSTAAVTTKLAYSAPSLIQQFDEPEVAKDDGVQTS